MREITAIGDLNKDGYPDLVAAQTSNHDLYLYPGHEGHQAGRPQADRQGRLEHDERAGRRRGLQPRRLPRPGRPADSTGKLFLFPGRKRHVRRQEQIGTGWNTKRDLIGVGDFDRDGYPDLAAVHKSNGNLLLYRGTGTDCGRASGWRTGYRGRSPLL